MDNIQEEAPPNYFDLDAWEAYQSRIFFAHTANNLALLAYAGMFGLILTGLGMTGRLGAPDTEVAEVNEAGLYLLLGFLLFGTMMGLWLIARDDRGNLSVQRTFQRALKSLMVCCACWCVLKVGRCVWAMVS